VRQDETGIEVHTADGRRWRARYAIVAVPLNTLGAMTCKRRSDNPSVKWPDCPVAPEQNSIGR
jgi:monoamine oxidase